MSCKEKFMTDFNERFWGDIQNMVIEEVIGRPLQRFSWGGCMGSSDEEEKVIVVLMNGQQITLEADDVCGDNSAHSEGPWVTRAEPVARQLASIIGSIKGGADEVNFIQIDVTEAVNWGENWNNINRKCSFTIEWKDIESDLKCALWKLYPALIDIPVEKMAKYFAKIDSRK